MQLDTVETGVLRKSANMPGISSIRSARCGDASTKPSAVFAMPLKGTTDGATGIEPPAMSR
jgi:hypothetical protein